MEPEEAIGGSSGDVIDIKSKSSRSKRYLLLSVHTSRWKKPVES